MSTDPATGTAVLFGGDSPTGAALNDTWVWSGGAWSQKFTGTSPPARSNSGLAFDSSIAEPLLFGGSTRSPGPFLADTWAWNGGDWAQMRPLASPDGRFGFALADDVANASVVLFGGYDGGGATHSGTGTPADTWSFETPAQSSLSPSVGELSLSQGSTSGGTMMTIYGTNFSVAPGTTTVSFGDPSSQYSVSGQNTTVQSSTQLTVTAPYECNGFVDVVVSTPSGSSGRWTGDHFRFVSMQPGVSALSTSTGPSSGPTTVRITGHDLMCPSVVTISGVTAAPDTSVPNTPTQYQVVVPPQPGGTSGDTTVTTPGGSSPAIASDVFTWVAPPPAVTGVSPAGASEAGGGSVVLTGSGLSFARKVTFGTAASPKFTVNNDSTITAVAPPGCGSVSVTVQTAAGTTAPLTYAYQQEIPRVTALGTNSGAMTGGNAVTISGTGLLCANGVTFGGTPAQSFSVDSYGQITAVSSAGLAPGIVDVVVSSPYGSSQSTSSDSFTYDDTPTVTGVSPNAGVAAGGTTVTVSGTNFVPGASVLIGGRAATNVAVVSPTQLTASTPSAPSAGLVDVVVTTPGGSSQTVGADTYMYGGPVVTGLSVAAGPSGGGIDVQIRGSNFAAGAQVSFGGQVAASVTLSSTLIDIPSSPAGSGGSTVDVTVTTPAGGSPTGTQDRYSFVVRPKVTSISPQNGPPAGGTSVTITGTALTTSPAVFFGGLSASSVTVNADGTLTAISPPNSAGAQVDVTVRTPGGLSAKTASDVYSYPGPPQASGVVPTYGPTGGGNVVTIWGSNFFGTPTVTFGSRNATQVQVVNGNQITCVVPAASSSGNVSVTVTTGSGSTSAGSYSYDPVPSVSGVSPNATSAGGGTSITVTGTGFLHNVQVMFGTPNGPRVTPSSVGQSGTSLTVTTPLLSGPPPGGVVDVVVVTAGGSSSTGQQDWLAYGPPQVTSLSPPGGPTSGGATVSIHGSAFVPGVSVQFAGTGGSSVHIVSASTLTVTSPGHSSGIVDVTVSNAVGSSQLTSNDTYDYGPPSLSAINPTSGPISGGQQMTLSVTNFDGDQAQVTFDGSPVGINGYQQTGLNQGILYVTVPSRYTPTTSTAAVAVSTDGGQSNSQSFTYYGIPQIYSVGPVAGPASGGRTIQVSGQNFRPGMRVVFNGALAPSYSVLSSTSMTVVTPNVGSATGYYNLITTDTFGQQSPIVSGDVYQFVGQGWWMVQANGCVAQAGAAPNFGGCPYTSHPIVAISPTIDGNGYWLVASDGGVFPFGDAGGYGSIRGLGLAVSDVTGMAATPDGQGYWIVRQGGGVYTFGDARYHGQDTPVGGRTVIGIAGRCVPNACTPGWPGPDGGGYWELQNDGGVFPYGLGGYGSAVGTMAGWAVNIVPTADGGGYWIGSGGGSVRTFGDAYYNYYGDASGTNTDFIGVDPTPTGNGYWIAEHTGNAIAYGDANYICCASPYGPVASFGLFAA